MTNRLLNIDLIKFLSIIIMVVDHMILVSMGDSLNIAQALFFTYVPLCQMGFLMASGYLMAFSFKKEKFNKYIFRVALFIVLFVFMTWLTNEELISSGSILINFAISTAIALFFLYRDKINELLTFMAILFGLDIVFQIFQMNGITVLNDALSNYPYPVNSFSLYFLLGIALFFYKDQLRYWFKTNMAKWMVAVLLICYSYLYLVGIYVNDYNFYQHLPVLILASAFIGLYFFFAWEGLKLPNFIHQSVIIIADALLYIYVIHYIVFFGWLREASLLWWQLSLVLIVVILLSIGLQKLIRCGLRVLSGGSVKV